MRQSITFPIALLSFILAAFAALTPVARAEARCFPETSQCLDGRIRQYWEQNGGLPVFGFPITAQAPEANRDTGQTYQTQWMERNRFELHPENAGPYDVLLGRLGDDRLRQKNIDWQTLPKAQPSSPHFFAQTGHGVAHEPFWQYWRGHGLDLGDPGISERESLALFGLPISETAMETNASGDTVLTQWFERARFEYHPNNPEPYKVLLGLLGNEIRAAQAAPAPTPSPTPSPAPIPTPTPNACADVPDPVSARLRPAKCVKVGTTIEMDIFGFTPNEQLGFWLTAPDGSMLGTRQTLNIGPTGAVDGLDWPTTGMPAGLWYFVFQGTSSNHQSIIYFKVQP